jgi:hypothetical protein
MVVSFVRGGADLILRVEISASAPHKGRALVYRPADDKFAFRVGNKGGASAAAGLLWEERSRCAYVLFQTIPEISHWRCRSRITSTLIPVKVERYTAIHQPLDAGRLPGFLPEHIFREASVLKRPHENIISNAKDRRR